ncbi:MAG: hypothetical protein V4673_16920 [Pseudomonadota bacterium]
MNSPPPRVSEDISFSAFETDKPFGEWLVESGDSFFKGDFETIRVLRSLAEATNSSYDRAYDAYLRMGPATLGRSEYETWCESRRSDIEGLKIREPDRHMLRFRRILFGESTVDRIGRLLSITFTWPLAFVCAIVAVAGIAAAAFFQVAAHPPTMATFPATVACVLLGVFIHEFGHTTAAVRFGAKQGGIGAGIYWIWPALYSDVRQTWKLPRSQRLIVSAGGLYFQSMYVAALYIGYLLTGYAFLRSSCGITIFLMLTTLNPVFKYDGYWIITDMTNSVNLHKRIRGTFLALRLGRRSDEWRKSVSSRSVSLAAGFLILAAAYLLYVFATLLPVLVSSVELFGQARVAYAAASSVLPNGRVLADASLGILGIVLISLMCLALMLKTLSEVLSLVNPRRTSSATTTSGH